MTQKFSNFAETVLAASCLAADTTLYIDDADNFPTITAPDTCKLTIRDGLNEPEIVTVTNRTGTVLTVTRAQESTAAIAWPAGAEVILAPTAAQFQAIYNLDSAALYFGTAAATSTNAWTVTLTALPGLTSSGTRLSFITPGANTDALTVRMTDGTTTTSYLPVTRASGSAFETGDIPANWLVELEYDAVAVGWKIISQISYNDEIYQINDAPFAQNFAANRNFDLWDAGTSFSSPASGTETTNDWFVRYDGTIGTFTVSRQAHTLGQTSVPGEPKYFLRWDHTAAGSGSTYRDLEWKDEQDVRWCAGEDATFALNLKASGAISVTAQIIQNFGTGGSPSSEVIVASEVWSVTTSWQRFDVQSLMSSLTGKTIGSNEDGSVILRLKLPVNSTFTLDVGAFQPEKGNRQTMFNAQTAVPFEVPLALGFGGTGKALTAPGADNLFFFDFSAGNTAFASISTGLLMTGTVFTVSTALQAYETAALTASELTQLGNINSVAITNAQWAGVGSLSAFVITLLDDATAGAFMTTLGISAFAQTILDDANAAAVQTTLSLVPGTHVQAYDADLAALAANSTTGFWAYTGAGTGSARTFSATAPALITNGAGTAGNPVVSVDVMTAAQWRANTATKVVTTDTAWSAAAVVTLTDAATIAVDMSTFINAKVTLGGNRTLGQPSNATKIGQSGCIEIIQDATGSRTLTYHADWYFAGGTDPTLSTAANARDLLFYQILNDGKTFGSLVKAVA